MCLLTEAAGTLPEYQFDAPNEGKPLNPHTYTLANSPERTPIKTKWRCVGCCAYTIICLPSCAETWAKSISITLISLFSLTRLLSLFPYLLRPLSLTQSSSERANHSSSLPALQKWLDLRKKAMSFITLHKIPISTHSVWRRPFTRLFEKKSLCDRKNNNKNRPFEMFIHSRNSRLNFRLFFLCFKSNQNIHAAEMIARKALPHPLHSETWERAHWCDQQRYTIILKSQSVNFVCVSV